MLWTRTFTLGFIIWLVLFFLTSIIASLDILGAFGIRSVLVLSYGFSAYLASKMIKPHMVKYAVLCGFTWLLICIILDAIFTVRFNPDLFRSEFQWLGYFMLIWFPVLGVDKTHRPDVSSMTVD